MQLRDVCSSYSKEIKNLCEDTGVFMLGLGSVLAELWAHYTQCFLHFFFLTCLNQSINQSIRLNLIPKYFLTVGLVLHHSLISEEERKTC